jgi:uncharacterized protein (DUF362 family)
MTHTVAVAPVRPVAYPAPPFDPPNSVYSAVEEALAALGLDAAHCGTPQWNPLGFIRPGSRVLLKPNLVRHFHPYGYDTDSLYTHGSILRAVCDYALRALHGTGQVVIADAPLQTCDFAEVTRLSGVQPLVAHYRSLGQAVQLRDLRLVRSVAGPVGGGPGEVAPWWRRMVGRVLVPVRNDGDPRGYTEMCLDADSLHAQRERDGRFRVTCYDPAAMNRYHGGGRHRYIVANSLLEADVVINLPKLKTHQKAGLTCALKNFVGVNGHKDCLPHHVQGALSEGGDEYARPSTLKWLDSRLQDYKEVQGGVWTRKAVGLAHRVLEPLHRRQTGNPYWAGSWSGNDTISRTTIDLNRIVRYGGLDGQLQAVPQRTVLHLADAVIAGEGDGPLAPTPKPAGLILASWNPVAMDLIAARLMGYRWQAIPTLRHAVETGRAYALWDGAPVRVRSSEAAWDGLGPDDPGGSLEFEAHKGWKSQVEREPLEAAAGQ